MNVMRHLRVPNNSVQDVIVLLKDNALHSETMRIFPDSDGKHRLIPLSEQAPDTLPALLDGYQVVIVDGVPYGDDSGDWWEHLLELVGEESITLHGESWPSNHEFIGDMMIVRIEEDVSQYRNEIAYSKMTAHPRVRILMEDRGVQGEFRIRDLVPIALREDDELTIGDISEDKIDTRVMVRESGKMILCDPTKAYFSTKLQAERIETLSMARRLREILGRPIRVCDPFCGVGPALANIITEESLVSDVLAADLNPDAISMLLDNLRRWDGRKYPETPSAIQRLFPDRIVGVADATELSSIAEMSNSWDMLVVNLPHKTIELLPGLIHLLDNKSPSLIRGRVIIAESDIEETIKKIVEITSPLHPHPPSVNLKVKRDYSSTLRLCSFEAWLGIAECHE